MNAAMNEAVVEAATLDILSDLGWGSLYGPDLAPGGVRPERVSYADPILQDRLRAALERLNPDLPAAAITEAARIINQTSGPTLLHANWALHTLITDGVAVELLEGGVARGRLVKVVDFDQPDLNTFLAVNQFTVTEGNVERRPDVVLFVNGLPLAVIELKNAASEDADVWQAWRQLQTYQTQIPRLFYANAVLVASDGLEARMGGVGTPKERFVAWKTIDGEELASASQGELEVLLKGMFAPTRFLDFVRSFVVFEQDPDREEIVKKIAAYHQFHAVRKALSETVRAADVAGDRRGGVIWHTQGSGKSLTMLFFAGKLVLEPAMANPTIVMLTDRNDLDDQLFGQFARGHDLLRQIPEQAERREELRGLLRRAAGGVVFTTVQKFMPDERGDAHPLLSDRRNIVVMADEAHRSQYDFIDGYARHIRDALPNATFVGFTGTPLELDDKDTRLVFGDYIDVYDIERAVADGATVPIYYESRLVPLDLPAGQEALLDTQFEELTEAEEGRRREKLKTKWTQLEEVVGTPKRIDAVARDLVAHFERRQEALAGKAMIVGMSRRICVDLYDAIARLRPDWISDDDAAGKLKVVMTGSASDPEAWQPHIRTKAGRRAIEARFKDPDDPLQLVIVRDMWLTGFDVPPLHTMYLDKPMRGHGLMQTIARVNRVFRDKPGGLIVDYLGLANNLREALRIYSESGGRGRGVAGVDDRTPEEGELVAVLLEKLDICRGLLHGFDYGGFLTGSAAERLAVIPKAQEFVLLHELREPGFRKRFDDQVLALVKAFALAGATEAARRVKAEIAFFQTVKAALTKKAARGQGQEPGDLDHAIRQLIDQAITPGGVVDIFSAAGLAKPDISILSEGFLEDVRELEHKNLAVELLRKLLNDEIASRGQSNVVEERRFSERLKQALGRYQNRSVETAQVIEELLQLAREIRESQNRGEQLGLTPDELAFYDALGGADMAAVMGDQPLLTVAREVAATVRQNATIDWTVRESVRANMRRMVKRTLNRLGYPPDKRDGAVETVVRQAELFSAALAA